MTRFHRLLRCFYLFSHTASRVTTQQPAPFSKNTTCISVFILTCINLFRVSRHDKRPPLAFIFSLNNDCHHQVAPPRALPPTHIFHRFFESSPYLVTASHALVKIQNYMLFEGKKERKMEAAPQRPFVGRDSCHVIISIFPVEDIKILFFWLLISELL